MLPSQPPTVRMGCTLYRELISGSRPSKGQTHVGLGSGGELVDQGGITDPSHLDSASGGGLCAARKGVCEKETNGYHGALT